MPELPDLHVYSENLEKLILNKTIVSVTVYDTRKIDTPSIFSEKLQNASIQNIVREGKELHFMLTNGNSFGVHLMLSGKFFITTQEGAEKIKSKIAALFFEDGQAFVICDYQGLCKVTLNPKVSKVPDALSKAFTLEYFRGIAKKNPWRNIKAALIDQHIVRGIGNAYVDEILWKADISPQSVLGKIPEENLKVLYEAISFVLNDAIQNIRKIAPDIINGEERSFLQVHNSNKTFTDNGDRIIVKTVATKKTYFTEKQKLFL